MWMRVFARLAKKSVLRKGLSPGFQLPARLAAFRPDDDVTWTQALEPARYPWRTPLGNVDTDIGVEKIEHRVHRASRVSGGGSSRPSAK